MTPLVLCVYAMPLAWFPGANDPWGIAKFFLAAFLAFLAAFRNGFPRLAIDRLWLLTGVSLVASTLFSHNPAVSAMGQYRVFTSGLLPMVLVAVMFYLAAGAKDSHENLFRHVVTVACISSGWALLQTFGLLAPIPLSDGRPYAGFGSAVYLASFLAMAFPLALGLGLHKQAALILFGIILTETRAGLIAIAVGAAFWYWSMWRLGRKEIAVILGGLLLLGGIMSCRRTDILMADVGRVIVYKTAYRIFSDNKMWGYGPDLFLSAFLEHRGADWAAAGFSKTSAQGTAHNDILQSLACGGILWTLAYLALCLSLAVYLFFGGQREMLAAAVAMFTYAKFNETALSVKIVFFILLGSTIRSINGNGVVLPTLLPRLATGLILALVFTHLVFDRIAFWARLTESPRIMEAAMRFFRIYGG